LSEQKKVAESLSRATSHIWGAKTPNPIGTKFCTGAVVNVADIITQDNFDDDRFWVFWSQGVKFLVSPLTFALALKTAWHCMILPVVAK